MNIQAHSVDDYLTKIPAERTEAFNQLRNTILENLPSGFEETLSYGMIGYVVPHSIYPEGYHCDPKLPLPFINIASQKSFIALYHNGLYADQTLLKWFKNEYPNHTKFKLDMGKSCVRFKRANDIPFKLIGTLCQKITPKAWIAQYETNIKRKAYEK